MELFVCIFCLFCFIAGYATACILYTSKKEEVEEKENLALQPSEPTYEQIKIKQLQSKIKDEQLKTSYYIQIINEIEKECKNQQFNSVINLINKVKTIISPEEKYNIEKRKELTKTATNEND